MFSRRILLRGAGAAVALPFLESLAPAAAIKPPLRLGIVSVTGGTVIESWKMPAAGPLAKLPSILRPLEFAKDELLILTGLAHHGAGEGLNGHEHAGYLHLTGAPKAGKIDGRPFAGVSVDQAAAKVLGARTLLPSLELGMSNHETRYAWRGPEQPAPFEADPRVVFERLFRGRPPVAPNWAKRGEPPAEPPKSDSLEQAVLDAVRADAKRLDARLGAADRARLAEFLDAVHAVERRVRRFDALVRQEAVDAKEPGPSKAAPPVLPANARALLHKAGWDPDLHAEYTRLMAELFVLAFQTDSTRVATFAIGDDGAAFPGVVTVGYEHHAHTLEHQGNPARDGDPVAREGCRQIHAWYTGLFAEMVRRMKSIDEGGSSLLDNCLLLYTSYMADGGHSRSDFPVALVGKAQGSLKTGRQVDFPLGTPMSNLFVEMLDRVGAPVDAFGESATSKKAAFGGRLPGLG
ncbi:MAG TPA: DUF1552 domain-containing protein [Planctomycetota bacterium]